MKTTEMFGIKVANCSMDVAGEYLCSLAKNDDSNKYYVGGLNVNQLLLINDNKKLESIYQKAGFVFPDGQPIMWMAKKLGCPLEQKLSGPDLVIKTCEKAEKEQLSVYFLGGAENSPQIACEKLKKKFPKLQIAGYYSPPFGFEKNPAILDEIIGNIKESEAKILFVGLGSPKQDYFIADNMEKYGVPVSLSIGIAIDFIAGNVKRAPRWMRRIGLEWFHRMLQDPRRLVKRYLIDDWRVIGIFRRYKKSVKK